MKRIIVAAASAAVLAVPAAAQAAGTTRPIRESDLVTTADSGNASHAFLADGLRVDVPDTSSYVVLRWAAGVPLTQVTSVDYNWTGTDNKPGVKYDVDADGDGTIDCELVGEAAYGGKDVWLNADGGSADHGTNAETQNTNQSPSYCEDNAPVYNSTSYTGDPWHGDVAAWSAKFGPKAVVVHTGIGASGLVQQGVLNSVDVGPNHYTFTNQPATQVASPSVVDVTGNRAVHQTRHAIAFRFSSDAQRAGTTTGRNLIWTVLVNGHRRFSVTQGPGQRASYRFVNHSSHHRKVVRLYRNGVAVGRFVVGKA